MIGERIRRVRLQLGLSQSQLAGKEMTRAFISQVENGKCAPSAQTLRILAERLGKPIAYFLEESPAGDFGARFLWESARADAAAGDWQAALPKLEHVLHLLRRGDHPEQEVTAQFLYARCLANLHQLEPALDQLEDVLERFRTLARPAEMHAVYLEMGRCTLGLEQFVTARRLLTRVVRLTAGSKFAHELHAEALELLGTVHLRLGDYSAALQTFQAGLHALPAATGVAGGRMATGLSAAYLRLGDAGAAREWSQQALRALKAAGSPDALAAERNLALAELALGQPEEGYARLRRVLVRYQEAGNTVAQASVLLDSVGYWRLRQDWVRAERLCWQALDLLPVCEQSWLRGVAFGQLGEITASQGKPDRAQELLSLSYELLRRVRASGELRQTMAAMQALGVPAPAFSIDRGDERDGSAGWGGQ